MKTAEIITEFIAKVMASLQAGTFIRLTVTRPAKVLGRLVEIQGQPVLSLTFREATRDVTKNLPVADVAGWLGQQKIQGALLSTTQQDWQLTPKHLIAHKPSVTVAPVRTHDRQKQTFLDDSAQVWLNALHTTPKKRQQIDRYLEIFTHLAEGVELRTIVDMGCGKGYLTFGLWHLLRTRIIGVEQRPDLVAASNQLARQIGAAGLEFVTGTIQSVELPAVDALIALHACDTATDDAIRRGVTAVTNKSARSSGDRNRWPKVSGTDCSPSEWLNGRPMRCACWLWNGPVIGQRSLSLSPANTRQKI